MQEIQHARDRRRFKENIQLAKKTEELMKRQREGLGLPEPKGKNRFDPIIFRPHQPRD